jgi:ATP diphosphatase
VSGIDRLLEIMARLRDPERGCPWDVEQTFETIAPYTVEEAYEVDDAIRRGDTEGLRDELGDLLLQVVFHARIAQEQGAFGFEDVVQSICDKLVRRHPHVFGEPGDAPPVDSARAQKLAWERTKTAERERTAEREGRSASLLDGVALGLPALLRAAKLLRRAARGGFEWPDTEHAFAKLAEELEEVRAELEGGDRERLHEELGDLLYATVGLAHALELDPEQALRDSNAKFEGRLRRVEAGLERDGRRMQEAGIEELLERWERAKQAGEPW